MRFAQPLSVIAGVALAAGAVSAPGGAAAPGGNPGRCDAPDRARGGERAAGGRPQTRGCFDSCRRAGRARSRTSNSSPRRPRHRRLPLANRAEPPIALPPPFETNVSTAPAASAARAGASSCIMVDEEGIAPGPGRAGQEGGGEDHERGRRKRPVRHDQPPPWRQADPTQRLARCDHRGAVEDDRRRLVDRGRRSTSHAAPSASWAHS